MTQDPNPPAPGQVADPLKGLESKSRAAAGLPTPEADTTIDLILSALKKSGWSPEPARPFRCSKEIGKLSGALARAQGKFQTPKKDKEVSITTNKGATYTFKYADLAEVFASCRAALAENEIAIVQPIVNKNGKLYVETIASHSSGEWIASELAIGPEDGEAKELAGRITYMRRYGVTSLLGIASEDDDDINRPGMDPESRAGGNDQRRERRDSKPAKEHRKPAEMPPDSKVQFLGEVHLLERMSPAAIRDLREKIVAHGFKRKEEKADEKELNDLRAQVGKIDAELARFNASPAGDQGKKAETSKTPPGSQTPPKTADQGQKQASGQAAGVESGKSEAAPDAKPTPAELLARYGKRPLDQILAGKIYHGFAGLTGVKLRAHFHVHEVTQTGLRFDLEDPAAGVKKPGTAIVPWDQFWAAFRISGEVTPTGLTWDEMPPANTTPEPSKEKREEIKHALSDEGIEKIPARLGLPYSVAGIQPLSDDELALLSCLKVSEIAGAVTHIENQTLFSESLIPKQDAIEPLTAEWLREVWLKAMEAKKDLRRDARKFVRVMIEHHRLRDRVGKTKDAFGGQKP